MSQSTDLQAVLTDALLPYFEHKKYTWHSALNQFIRPTRFGHAGVAAALARSGNRYIIKFSVGIRIHLVELRLSSLFGATPYYQLHSYTLIPSYEQLSNQKHVDGFLCASEHDILRAVDAFIAFMDYQGFSFLDHYRKLAHLDELFNQQFETARRWNNQSYQGGFRAMVIAKIRNRLDMERLYHIHRQHLIDRGHKGTVVEKFDANFAQLKIHALN